VNNQHELPVKTATYAANPLRVSLVTETFAPEVNGVAMTLGHLVRGLLARDHAVQIVRPQQASPSLTPNDSRLQEILTTGFPIPGYSNLRFGMPAKARLMALWKQQRPDVVHVATEGPLGWSAVAAASRLGVPLTSSFHTNFDAYSGHYGLGLFKVAIDAHLRTLHNRTLATLIPTATQMETLQARGYRNVSVMARGVDTALFTPTRRSESLRASWGLRANDLAVVHVGRLAKEKNLDVVLKAFKAIQLREPKARLILVGDGPMLQGLQSSAQGVILAGVQRGDDLAAHYASGDIFLFPSVTETYGNVVPEALASGLAVVAYQYASAAMLIRHEASGLLAKFDDEPAFLMQALRMATDHGLRSTVRHASCDSIAHLSWDAVCESFIATLRNAAAQGANGAKLIKTPTPVLQPNA
jgi:glycosyltransferase involved in cell wall biosynthesis